MKDPIGLSTPHDSVAAHVRGDAAYVDDLPVINGTLHAAVGTSKDAHGHLGKIDLAAVLRQEGVVDAVSADQVQGNPNIGPVFHDENVFASGKVVYYGQPVFAVAATSEKAAQRAARQDVFNVRPLPPTLTVDEALRKRSFVLPGSQMPSVEKNWDPAKLNGSPHVLSGELHSGGQEHFYLEGQVSYVIPQDGGRILVHSSTQHPGDTQHVVASLLGLDFHDVEVVVRRMGGGFGGKETQAVQTAAIAAMLAARTKRPVKIRLPRMADFLMTGKRHPFLGRYKVGFDDKGKILAVDFIYAADCGCSTDLSLAVVNRALLHADNAYYLPCARLRGYLCKTNKVSNTAFRGFGGPQGMLLIEQVIADIASHLDLDALEVRRRNCYRGTRQKSQYGQVISDNILPQMIDKLARTAKYSSRRKAIEQFNDRSPHVKKGLALIPLKFGISFTATFLNKAGAVIQLYNDGSVLLNHGGTEMGQGLYIKVAQVVAATLGLPLEKVRCSATTTSQVPNTSATAASAGFDLNGKAAQNAALKLRARLAKLFAAEHGVSATSVQFADGHVSSGNKSMSVADLANTAFFKRVSMSAQGFYATPKVKWDSVAGKGRPFFYYAYGAAVSEVAVDVLTGEHRLLQVDLLHDAGFSVNPAVDLGQIIGGYAQGYGWLTSEELIWNDQGRPLALGPATYKIPAISTMPERFNVDFWHERNKEDTIYRSKGVGEPPLMLSLSAWQALANAVAAARGDNKSVVLDTPATPERILFAINAGLK